MISENVGYRPLRTKERKIMPKEDNGWLDSHSFHPYDYPKRESYLRKDIRLTCKIEIISLFVLLLGASLIVYLNDQSFLQVYAVGCLVMSFIFACTVTAIVINAYEARKITFSDMLYFHFMPYIVYTIIMISLFS